MSPAIGYEFYKQNSGLSSFVNLVMMLQELDGPGEAGDWSSYLKTVSLIPAAGGRPGHPFELPLSFPPEGPPDLLPAETARAVEQRFEELRDLSRRIEESLSGSGEPNPRVLAEIGPQALATIRALGADLETFRFASGEAYILGLRMRQAIPADQIAGATLIQILDELAEVDGGPKEKRLSARADRLIYRLPEGGAVSLDPARRQTRLDIGRKIERTFSRLFPKDYAIVELRDTEAATVYRGELLGPTFAQLEQQKAEIRAKGSSS